jgi:hypothetical protein
MLAGGGMLMGEIYHHTQVGKVMVVALTAVLAVLLWAGARDGWPPGAIAVLAVVSACVILFTTLTVRVGDGVIQVRFGPGLPRRTIALARIAGVRAIKSSWFAGYGIHWVGKGWLYNVSGRDAVELTLENGRILLVGTDEPEELVRALRRAGAEVRG